MSMYPTSIPRCQHIKVNGTLCGSPALHRRRYCFFHHQWRERRLQINTNARRRARNFDLPVLEDANSIQIALMQVMRLLVAQQIEHKTASLLLYALQTASTNLRMTKFDPLRHDVVLDPRTVADTPLDASIWEDEDFEEEEEDEAETEADRAIAAIETARKKKEEEAKWMRWAEAQYPKPNQPANQPQSPPPETL